MLNHSCIPGKNPHLIVMSYLFNVLLFDLLVFCLTFFHLYSSEILVCNFLLLCCPLVWSPFLCHANLSKSIIFLFIFLSPFITCMYDGLSWEDCYFYVHIQIQRHNYSFFPSSIHSWS